MNKLPEAPQSDVSFKLSEETKERTKRAFSSLKNPPLEKDIPLLKDKNISNYEGDFLKYSFRIILDNKKLKQLRETNLNIIGDFSKDKRFLIPEDIRELYTLEKIKEFWPSAAAYNDYLFKEKSPYTSGNEDVSHHHFTHVRNFVCFISHFGVLGKKFPKISDQLFLNGTLFKCVQAYVFYLSLIGSVPSTIANNTQTLKKFFDYEKRSLSLRYDCSVQMFQIVKFISKFSSKERTRKKVHPLSSREELQKVGRMLSLDQTYSLAQDSLSILSNIMSSCVLEMGTEQGINKIFRTWQGSLSSQLFTFWNGQRSQLIRRITYLGISFVISGIHKSDLDGYIVSFKEDNQTPIEIPKNFEKEQKLARDYSTMNHVILKSRAIISFLRNNPNKDIRIVVKTRNLDVEKTDREGGNLFEFPATLTIPIIYHLAFGCNFRVEREKLCKNNLKDLDARFKIFLNYDGDPATQIVFLKIFVDFQKQIDPSFKMNTKDARRNMVSNIKEILISKNVSSELIEEWEVEEAKRMNTSTFILGTHYERIPENYVFNRDTRRFVGSTPFLNFSQFSSFSQIEQLQGKSGAGSSLQNFMSRQITNCNTEFVGNVQIDNKRDMQKIIDELFVESAQKYKESPFISSYNNFLFGYRKKLLEKKIVLALDCFILETNTCKVLFMDNMEKPFNFSVIIPFSFLENLLSKQKVKIQQIITGILSTIIGEEFGENKNQVNEKFSSFLNTFKNISPVFTNQLGNEDSLSLMNKYLEFENSLCFLPSTNIHFPSHSISLLMKDKNEAVHEESPCLTDEIILSMKEINLFPFRDSFFTLKAPQYPSFFEEGEIDDFAVYFIKEEFQESIFSHPLFLENESMKFSYSNQNHFIIFDDDDEIKETPRKRLKKLSKK